MKEQKMKWLNPQLVRLGSIDRQNASGVTEGCDPGSGDFSNCQDGNSAYTCTATGNDPNFIRHDS